MRDIITTALGPDGSRIHIDKSIAGDRYGGIAHHQKCQLYPVFRHRGWRSSFAHMPNRTHCAPPSGESPEHKNVKRGWLEFLQDQLSGCFVCVAFGRNSPHLDCPVILTESSSVQPFYTEIAWVCAPLWEEHLPRSLDHLYNVPCRCSLMPSGTPPRDAGHSRSTKTLSMHRPLPSMLLNALRQQHAGEGLAGELAALVGVEDLWPTCSRPLPEPQHRSLPPGCWTAARPAQRLSVHDGHQ